MNRLKSTDFYYCYDLGLIKYLKSKGFNYITKARHLKTNKIFAMFEPSEELQKYIDKWQEAKKVLD